MNKLKSVDELSKVYWKHMRRKTTAKPSPLPYRPRWLNWMYAALNSYFWLPCIKCGRYSSGHEWYGSINHDHGGHGICPQCSLDNYNRTGDWDEPPNPQRFQEPHPSDITIECREVIEN